MKTQRNKKRSRLKARDERQPRLFPLSQGKTFAPRWNYEPCKAEVGSAIVGVCKVQTYWHNGLEGTRRKCVKVVYGESTFFIDNEDGRGFMKVFIRGGGPDSPHASLPVDDPSTFALEGFMPGLA